MTKQLLRLGSSVGAFVWESQKECITDYINKEMFDEIYNKTSKILKMIRSATLSKERDLNNLSLIIQNS